MIIWILIIQKKKDEKENEKKEEKKEEKEVPVEEKLKIQIEPYLVNRQRYSIPIATFTTI